MSDVSIQMILTCPSCGTRHIDDDTFATKPHHTHACQSCGMVWRPAIVPTTGVEFLPGFKNVEAKRECAEAPQADTMPQEAPPLRTWPDGRDLTLASVKAWITTLAPAVGLRGIAECVVVPFLLYELQRRDEHLNESTRDGAELRALWSAVTESRADAREALRVINARPNSFDVLSKLEVQSLENAKGYAELCNAREESDRRGHELDQLRTEYERVRKDRHDRINTEAAELQRRDVDLAALREQNEQLATELADAAGEATDAQTANAVLRRELGQLRGELRAKDKRIAEKAQLIERMNIESAESLSLAGKVLADANSERERRRLHSTILEAAKIEEEMCTETGVWSEEVWRLRDRVKVMESRHAQVVAALDRALGGGPWSGNL